MIRRYLAGIITGTGDLLGRRRAEPECWWGVSAEVLPSKPMHAR
ncbi:hypothetical protein [Nocardioides sp.]|nr:hypothetical protein [Nocardioides sp.]MDO9457502.1 hypothetical protein [Nocardioides sp.]